MRYSTKAGFVGLLLCIASSVTAQSLEPFAVPKSGFTSWQPAADWQHALITGNGTLGALVYGQPHNETVILSHSSLFLPLNRPMQPIDQASRLAEIRKLLLEGRSVEAAKVPVDQRNKEGFDIGRDPFIPAFNLKIDQTPSNISQYQRSVNFETGETQVSWKDETGTYERKMFSSRSDSVIVLSIKGTGKINCRLNFESVPVQWNQWSVLRNAIGERKTTVEENWLTYRGSFKNQYQGGLHGYEGLAKVILKGGMSQVSGNQIKITGSDEVILLLKIRPSYNYSRSMIDEMKVFLNAKSGDYEDLLARHSKIHGGIFNRVKLDLKGDAVSRRMNSEELLLSAKDSVSKALIEKVYDAGRYNILSASGTNPPNLQGLWSGTWTAPWNSDFTHDGNLPSAIANNLSGNMPELMECFFNYHEKYLSTYRANARRLYGTRGIRIPAHTSTNGLDTDFGDVWCLTLWTGAAGWASHFFFDYYQYTGDRKFLSERAFPFMKEAALFYEDFLMEGKDGRYIFNPSYSPENNPLNNPSQAAINATMDVMIARQLLSNCIQAAKILAQTSKVKKWEQMLSKMPEYQVAKDGTLREWLWPDLEENHKHRHSSQLYALYDEANPDFLNNPRLLAAVNKTIDEKLKFRIAEGGGEMAFGLVQLGLVSAHIGERDKAKMLVDWLSSKYWSAGMGSFHNVGDLFNTDISGGLPAVINEMLVYSQPGLLSLLPSLPKDWHTGTIEGLLLRGQIELKRLSWSGTTVEVTLNSKIRQEIKLILPSEIRKIQGSYKSQQAKTAVIALPSNKDLTLIIQLNNL